ncbi:PEPxxWA-CTERM sorting domain-containing protein [Sphingomonas sp. ID1715]|uniref:PEPxxWA-CTERM sorting domain-containing protein n=1 Tax=Sphingomonas sp. ID1715 TaxID=1656898 RepID=UPI0014895331|nr:PEPxxWA-CTERM sorting domain-containing protein [Sphingomonas sp. ID1715]NNM75933.1 PEPxxWA-CTERM sorting domain-containing protein [Sphingomonas sp. ID1715]
MLRTAIKTAALALASAAQAPAAVIGTFTFDQPTGTVLSNVPIDINVTLTLDASSDAITTDGDGNVTSGLSEADIIAAGADPTQVARTFLSASFECSGTFTAVCNQGPPYDFDFDLSQFFFAQNFDLQPGQSFSFRFGTFTPTGGNAPAGTYSFNASALFGIQEDDGDVFYSHFADTCVGQDPACAFTRTVQAAAPGVPEPASWALMLAGFGLVGCGIRGRQRAIVLA